MRNGWMSAAVRWTVAVAMAVGAGAAIGKNEGNGNGNGNGRDDADKRDKDRRECPDGRELTLANGRIHLLDAANSVVSSVTIRNGKSCRWATTTAAAGRPADAARQPRRPDGACRVWLETTTTSCCSACDRDGTRRSRTAASFADIGCDLSERNQGRRAGRRFITTIGGFFPVQFAEKRLPNLPMLDAIARAPGLPASFIPRAGSDQYARPRVLREPRPRRLGRRRHRRNAPDRSRAERAARRRRPSPTRSAARSTRGHSARVGRVRRTSTWAAS